jgi:hypothetical protein
MSGEADHHGGRAWSRKATLFMVARKQRDRKERSWDKIYPSKAFPQGLTSAN